MPDPTPISAAEAAELVRLMKDLREITISDVKAFEQLIGGAEKFRKELQSLRKEQSNLNSDVNTFYETLKASVRELLNQKNASKDINSSFKKISDITSKLKYDQDDISTLSKNQIVSLQKKLEIEKKNLTESYKANEQRKAEIQNIFRSAQLRQNANLPALRKEFQEIQKAQRSAKGMLDDSILLGKVIQDRLDYEKKINETLGISGKIVDGIVGALGKLGISSEFFENLKEDMREVAKTGSKWDVLMTGVRGTVSGIGQALKDPVTQLTILLKIANFFFKAALNANAQAVELGKQLGYGTQRADAFREKMVAIERSSTNLNVNTKNLTQAFGELVKATGFAYEFSADQLETQIKLTRQVGLQADEAAQVQRYAALSGKSSEETYRSFVRGLAVTRNQLRVGIDFRSALAEAVKVSGQLAANLGYNPERIAAAIVQAKALGTTLEDTKSQAESLLNFESSIENELKAELLTGQALNLERARALALQGDMAGVAQELANQGMTAAKFSKMNVLAQNAYAQSLGTTSDKLAEQLRKREEAVKSGKSLQQISEEEAAQALERQNVQDKFNAAVEKLQSLFGNLMAGPLGSFLDTLSGGLSIINQMIPALKIIGGLYLLIKGYQLTSNILSTAALATNRAGFAVKAAQMGTEAFITREKGVQSLMDKQGLGARIIYNAQLLAGLVREQGIAGIKTFAATLDEKSLARKIIMGTYDAAAVVAERAKAGLIFLQTTYEKVSLMLKKQGLIFTIREAWKSIAGAAMAAFQSAAKIPVIGWVLGAAAAAGAVALGATLMTKGDDVVSPGYGKRTLMAPEGAIALNDKDTVIAGTNLGGGGGKESSGGGVSIDLSPVVNALAEVKAAIDQLINKEGIVMMDSVKVGTTQNMNGSYKTA